MFKSLKFEFQDEDIFRLKHHLKGRSGIAYGGIVFCILLLILGTGLLRQKLSIFVQDFLRFVQMLTHQHYTFRVSPKVTPASCSEKTWVFIQIWTILMAFGLWMFNLMILSQTSADLMHVDRAAYPTTLQDFLNSGLWPCWGTSMNVFWGFLFFNT